MKQIIILMFMLLSIGLSAQTNTAKKQAAPNTTIDANGNFVAIAKKKESTVASIVPQKYYDADGKEYDVYKGSKGGYYVLKTSKKTGNQYKYYLNIQGGEYTANKKQD